MLEKLTSVTVSSNLSRQQKSTTYTQNLPVIVSSPGEQPVTSSQDVADYFNKRHDNILRGIEVIKLSAPETFFAENFQESSVDRQSPITQAKLTSKIYWMTKDGFTLLAMGFTGSKALTLKVSYIKAFNALQEDHAKLHAAYNQLAKDFLEYRSATSNIVTQLKNNFEELARQHQQLLQAPKPEDVCTIRLDSETPWVTYATVDYFGKKLRIIIDRIGKFPMFNVRDFQTIAGFRSYVKAEAAALLRSDYTYTDQSSPDKIQYVCGDALSVRSGRKLKAYTLVKSIETHLPTLIKYKQFSFEMPFAEIPVLSLSI